jgi:leucyl aminopeptidase
MAMKILVAQGDIARFDAEALIVNLFEGVTSPGGGTGAVDQALEGILAQELSQSPSFKGKLGETLILPTYGKLPARKVIVVGLGKADKLDSTALRRAAAAAVRACQRLKVKTAATLLHGAGIGGFPIEAAARLLAEGALLGSYRFTKYKTRKPNGENTSTDEAAEPNDGLDTLTVVELEESRLAGLEAGIAFGQSVAESVCLARDWVFDSANVVNPAFMAARAQEIDGLECRILELDRLRALDMNLLLQVSAGSATPPRLVHLIYRPEGPPEKKIALVGKGITFDSGGLSLKPAGSMESMKIDMAGAAAVIAAMRHIAQHRSLPYEIHAVAPLCENMPSGTAGRPGDIIRSMNGKTVEINNTDAEGRLVLADALTYIQREAAPDEIIDLATLTGACVVALGKVAAGIMGTSSTLIESLIASGRSAGEKLWQLPLFDEYKDALKSDVADLINAGAKGEAGTPAAAMFLKEFIDNDRAWAHLDIAGPAYVSKETPEVPKGATGFGVRTLLYYLHGIQA